MDEKQILKISLVVSLLGIVALFIISSGIDLEAVVSLEGIPEEETVVVKGLVGRVSDTEKVVFVEVWNEKIEKTTAVVFKDAPLSLVEGDYVEITGTVEDYEGKKEIIGNKVVKK